MSGRQPELFATQPEPAPALFVDVGVPVKVRGTYTYAVPVSLAGRVAVGVRVAVPFGGQRVVGYVLGVAREAPANVEPTRIRSILAVLDVDPVFPAELLRFLREAADYYMHPIGDVLRAAAPAIDSRERAALSDGPDARGARWARVREETFVRLAQNSEAGAPTLRGGRQSQLVAIVHARGEVSLGELRAQWKGAAGAVASLVARGVLVSERREIAADPFFGAPVPRDVSPELVPAQRAAVDAIVARIRAHQRATFLLHGITGSGKTEVYLHSIAAAQQSGKGALILLPEIVLTPQLVARYRARFGDDLAVIHSGLKDADRFAMWRRLRSGECRVAIGARSAVFAPVQNLGVIVVDEEHDPSFKQEDNFRYHGRDLALLRAHRAGIVCVLGSATPSLESYHAALEGRHELLTLPHRATAAALPEVHLIDLRRVGRRGPMGHDLLSLPLTRALDETLSRGEQAILFLNRRGFAPSVRCTACDTTHECPACSVALVFHRREKLLKCHYCDFAAPFHGACLKCGAGDVTLIGVGTEKLEESLVDAFPRARIGRLDRDVASGAGAEAVLERLRRGEIDVLVGTQMVTKGHDIARVTLVGVISADNALSLPDFRASERTFQLLAQVAGRAGRRELPGRVLIQTWNPEHPAVRHAQTHDYVGFFAEEIAARRELGYPPIGRLACVRVDALDAARAAEVARVIAQHAREQPEVRTGEVRVVGPAAAPLEKVRTRHRVHMFLRAPERAALRRVLASIATQLDAHPPKGARVAIDVDPIHML